MNIGYVAMLALPRLCGALRRRGLWYMTRQDLLDALPKDHPRAMDAIFWFCQGWHDGDDDLYKIMSGFPESYMPRPWSPLPVKIDPVTRKEVVNKNYDRVLTELIEALEKRFGKITSPPLRPVKLAEVREGHVLTAGPNFLHIPANWPCRVYKLRGGLGVFCSAGAVAHGAIRVSVDSDVAFYPLSEDAEGYVVGFKR